MSASGPGDHAREHDGQRHAGDDGHDGGHQEHVADGLVEHGVGGLGGLAVLHHQVGHGLAADDQHAGGDDADRDERGADADERDAPGQPATEGRPAAGLLTRAQGSAQASATGGAAR